MFAYPDSAVGEIAPKERNEIAHYLSRFRISTCRTLVTKAWQIITHAVYTCITITSFPM